MKFESENYLHSVFQSAVEWLICLGMELDHRCFQYEVIINIETDTHACMHPCVCVCVTLFLFFMSIFRFWRVIARVLL